MRAAITAVVVLAGGFAAASAQASYVESPTVWDRTSAHYTAAPGEANDVSITLSDGRFLITDSGAQISVGEGCEVLDPPVAHRASCDSGKLEWARLIEFDLGDLDDSLTTSFSTDSGAGPWVNGGGGPGNDRFDVTAYGVAIHGDEGDEEMTAHGKAGGLGGGDGADRVMGTLEHGELDGGAGDDTLVTFEQPEPANPSDLPYMTQTVRGDEGNDRIESHGLRDVLLPGDGDDVVIGGPGNEAIYGGTGNDELHGGDGADELHGGEGADLLEGGGGDNISRSQGGYAIAGARLFADHLDGGPGADVLQGGPGDFDVADYSARGAPVSVTLDGLANDGETGEGDLVAADVEDATTGAGDDVLVGNGGPNSLRGGSGDDTIDGGGGYQDDAQGDNGDDTILMLDGGLEAQRGVQGALPGFEFDDLVRCDSWAEDAPNGDDTAFVDKTDVGQAGQVNPLDVPCEHVVMTEQPLPLPVQDGTVRVPLGCGAGLPAKLCSGDAIVTLPKRGRRLDGKRVAARSFRMRHGRTRRVRVRLNRTGRHAARGHRHLRAWVSYRYRYRH